MIVVKLQGGLGNQMFQYAVGRSLSLLHRTSLLLDLSFFDYQVKRDYALGIFNLPVLYASKKDVDKFHKKQKWYAKYLGRRYVFVVENSSGVFIDTIFKHKANLYLDGYWQNERYFIRISDEIKTDFSFSREPTEALIDNEFAVSVHVRRGDYVADASVNQVHGLCSLDYYKQAMLFIEKKVRDPLYYIFSDDMEWVKKNFTFVRNAVFVDANQNDYDDLRLMTYCKHHIIANSSFSWWGAWLGEQSDSIIVAPKQWFKDEKKNQLSQEIVPKRWVRI